MKKQAFLITVVVTMIIGFVRPGWTQEINAGGRDEVNAHKRLEGNHSNTIKDLKKKYPNAARKLYKDKKFLRKHPDIAKRIHSGNITADRREDVWDRRENVRDRREDFRDRRENRIDRREDVRDRRHGFRDRQEHIRDRRGDVSDRRKDIRGRRNEVTKADRLRKSGRGIKHHKHEIRDNKRDIRKKRRTTGQEIGQRRVYGNVPKGARMQSSGRRNRR